MRGVQCPAAPKQVAFSHVVASSTTSIGTHGGLQGGTDEITNDKGLKDSASADGILENVTDPLLKKKKKEYKEPWVIINSLVHLFLLLLFHMSLCTCVPPSGYLLTPDKVTHSRVSLFNFRIIAPTILLVFLGENLFPETQV